MSRAIGSLWVVVCSGVPLSISGCAMPVSGVCAGAGVGSCVGSLWSAWSGVVLMRGCSLKAACTCQFVLGGCGVLLALISGARAVGVWRAGSSGVRAPVDWLCCVVVA